MVRMLGEVARAAGLETVAEYVQSAAALSLLAKYKIDYAQGFYVGRAVALPPELGAAAGTDPEDAAEDGDARTALAVGSTKVNGVPPGTPIH
jgi:EAL domain-containing protein (putative c-di-GMP-specific phosphodiesterase class I)